MVDYDKYGLYRALEPKNSSLQMAWKVDNNPEINEHELLIDVKIINVNMVSFSQIARECEYNEEQIKKKILKIVKERGKLHNPITRTGGMLYGCVAEMGEHYNNTNHLKIGDEVVTLISLAAMPLFIEKIFNVDILSGQIHVEGKAVLFDSSLLVRKPENFPLELLISVLDVAGASKETFNIVKEDMNVAVLNPLSKIGILCTYSARKALKNTGNLIGVVKSTEDKNQILKYGVFDEVISCDTVNLKKFHKDIKKTGCFDAVINCFMEPNKEMMSVLITKDKGIAFFPSLISDCNSASLSAESIGKDVNIIPYKGYIEGYIDYNLELLRENKDLMKIFLRLLKSSKDKHFQWNQKNDEIDMENVLKNKEFTGSRKFVYKSKIMQDVVKAALKVADYDCTVFISGESGTGKEVVAKIIYSNSKRANKPFIKINCASIPENLLESELFGYEKGSFTGANSTGKKGLWELAKGGVLFLDEVTEMSLSIQAKLLRVLQENEFYRIGGTNPVRADARIICATNKDVVELVKQNKFREDLFYRLNVFPIKTPSLRERKEDIYNLVKMFVEEYNEKFDISKSIEKEAIEKISAYDWPGNIRELENFVQRLLIITDDYVVKAGDITRYELLDFVMNQYETDKMVASSIKKGETFVNYMERIEKDLFLEYKIKHGSSRKIANALKISQSNVTRKLKKYNLSDI